MDRNRIKRRLRDLFRRRRDAFGDFDIVINPRRTLLAASPADLERALSKVSAKVMERVRE